MKKNRWLLKQSASRYYNITFDWGRPGEQHLILKHDALCHPALRNANLTPSCCQDPDTAQQLVEARVVPLCMDLVRDAEQAPRQPLLTMLLANLTVLEAGAEQLLQLGQGNLEGFNV